jgi:hypothetical protein
MPSLIRSAGPERAARHFFDVKRDVDVNAMTRRLAHASLSRSPET